MEALTPPTIVQVAPLGDLELVPHDGRRLEPRPRRTTDVTLLRQWYHATLRPYEYITFRVVGEEGGHSWQAGQVLDLERRNLIVKPFVDAEEEAELAGLYTISLQPLEVWRLSSEEAPGDSLDTFVLQEPAKVDILSACGVSVDSRQHVYVWETRISDVEGCTELHNKLPLASRVVDLLSKQAPVLSLVDALESQGFQGVDEVVYHMEGVLVFDCRRLAGRRSYLQCVLYMKKLAAKGTLDFHSVGSAAYFDALLRAKGAVRPGLPAVEYKRLLALDEGDEVALVALPPQTPKPKARCRLGSPGRRPEPVADQQAQPMDESSDGSVVGGPQAPRGNARSGSGSGGVDVPPVQGGDAASVMGPAMSEARSQARCVMPEGVPPEIGGMVVRFVPGRRTTTHTYSDRVNIRCSNPAHIGCGKSRSLALMRDRFGSRCAEAFLGAWLQKADSMTGREHAKYTPRISDMEAYIAAHP